VYAHAIARAIALIRARRTAWSVGGNPRRFGCFPNAASTHAARTATSASAIRDLIFHALEW